MIARLGGLAFALLFAAAAAVQFVETLRARPLIAFAASVERNGSEEAASEDLVARVRMEIEKQEGCAHLLARSRVTASLFLLRQSAAAGRDEQWQALALASEQARRALACDPSNGNLWFVSGWLDHQLAPNAGLLKEYILSAIGFAPYEGRALESRWLTLSPVISELGFAQDAVIRADLDSFYERSEPVTVATVHEHLTNNGSAELAAAALGRLSEERREAIIGGREPSTSSPRQP